jgi:hypothetical protein
MPQGEADRGGETMTTTTETDRFDYRDMFCSVCQEYVTTVLINDQDEECPSCKDDCTLFESESEWVDALRHDSEEARWEADREDF